MARSKTVIGRVEYIGLPKLGIVRAQAKVDTGAYSSALHYHSLKLRQGDVRKELVVTFAMPRKRVVMVFKKYKRVSVKSSTGQTTRRYLITTTVLLNGQQIRTEFTLFDRSDMKNPVLLGRKFLRGRFVVDVAYKELMGR